MILASPGDTDGPLQISWGQLLDATSRRTRRVVRRAGTVVNCGRTLPARPHQLKLGMNCVQPCAPQSELGNEVGVQCSDF